MATLDPCPGCSTHARAGMCDRDRCAEYREYRAYSALKDTLADQARVRDAAATRPRASAAIAKARAEALEEAAAICDVVSRSGNCQIDEAGLCAARIRDRARGVG